MLSKVLGWVMRVIGVLVVLGTVALVIHEMLELGFLMAAAVFAAVVVGVFMVAASLCLVWFVDSEVYTSVSVCPIS